MFNVLLVPSAAKAFAKVDASLQRRIERALQQLGSNPHSHPNIKRLKGQFAGLNRFRTGDWRIIYRVDEGAKTVVVVEIGHRREVYE